MNPIGLSSFVLDTPFTDKSLALLPGVRELGYDLVEVSLAEPDSVDARKLGVAATRCGLGLRIAGNFGPGRSISSADEQERAVGLRYLLACLDVAAEAGADMVTGPMYSAVGTSGLLGPSTRREALERAAEALQHAAVRADALNLRLALEPLNRFENNLINTVDQGLALCKAVDSDRVGLALDTFHMNIEEKDLDGAIAVAGTQIFSFQASENDRGTPGSGHLPWPAIFAALHSAQYQGPVIVESFGRQSLELVNALSLWRPVADSMDLLAQESLAFVQAQLHRALSSHHGRPETKDVT